MAVTHYTLTANFTDLLGDAYPTSSKVVVFLETNLGSSEAVVDSTSDVIALGPYRLSADSTGLVTFANLVGSDSDPDDIGLASGTLQYRVRAEYANAATRKRSQQWYSGWFSLTANINLADVVTEVYAPAEWQTAFMEEAQALLDAMLVISGLTGEDAAVATLIAGTGGAGPLTRAELSASIAGTGGGLFAGKGGVIATAGNTHRFLTKLYRNVEDANVLHVGTSLGNATDEYVYLTWSQFVARFPTHTFLYKTWDTGTDDWTSATTLQTGTGSRTVTIYNGCVPGMRTDYFLGSRWAKVTATNADVTFVEYGKNEGPSSQITENSWRGQMLALTEQLRSDLPYTGVVAILEPLDTATNDMALKNRAYESIAQQLGIGVINTYDAFLATGHPTDYIKVDGIHPTTASDAPAPNGSQLMANCILAALSLNITDGAIPAQRSSLFNDLAAQLLTNGGFAAWSGSAPDGWTLVGATTSKDTRSGYFESGNGYSCRIQATGSAASSMYKEISDYARWKGKWVTVAVRMRVPAGAAGTSGRIQVTDGVAPVTSYAALADARGGFHWKILPFKVSSTAAYLRVTVYGDTAANASADVSVDRVFVVEGALPKTATEGLVGPTGATGPASSAAFDHLSTFGTNPAVTLAAATASATLNGANQAILVPIRPARDMSIAKLAWISRTSSGNYDISIYSATGSTRLWSRGLTAWPAGSTSVAIDEPVSPALALTAGTLYWVAFSGDNTTGAFQAGSPITALQDLMKLADGTNFARVVASSFPLPSSITLGSTASAKIPAIVLKEA